MLIFLLPFKLIQNTAIPIHLSKPQFFKLLQGICWCVLTLVHTKNSFSLWPLYTCSLTWYLQICKISCHKDMKKAMIPRVRPKGRTAFEHTSVRELNIGELELFASQQNEKFYRKHSILQGVCPWSWAPGTPAMWKVCAASGAISWYFLQSTSKGVGNPGSGSWSWVPYNSRHTMESDKFYLRS